LLYGTGEVGVHTGVFRGIRNDAEFVAECLVSLVGIPLIVFPLADLPLSLIADMIFLPHCYSEMHAADELAAKGKAAQAAYARQRQDASQKEYADLLAHQRELEEQRSALRAEAEERRVHVWDGTGDVSAIACTLSCVYVAGAEGLAVVSSAGTWVRHAELGPCRAVAAVGSSTVVVAPEKGPLQRIDLPVNGSPEKVSPIEGTEGATAIAGVDSDSLALGDASGAVRWIDLASGKSKPLVVHKGAVEGLSYAPWAKIVASLGQDGVALSDPASGETRWIAPKHGRLGFLNQTYGSGTDGFAWCDGETVQLVPATPTRIPPCEIALSERPTSLAAEGSPFHYRILVALESGPLDAVFGNAGRFVQPGLERRDDRAVAPPLTAPVKTLGPVPLVLARSSHLEVLVVQGSHVRLLDVGEDPGRRR
jgi:hypothetical protein